MSAAGERPESQWPDATQYQSASSGIWQIAWQRLKRDRVAMVSLIVVGLFLLTIVLSALGLIARDWDDQVGVSFANPSFLGKVDNNEALSAETAIPELAVPSDASIVDMRAVDPLADVMPEIEARAKALEKSVKPKSATLPFGGDKWGRDIIAKTIKGAQSSVFVGFAAAFIAVFLGTVLGAFAGYFGRWVNDLLEWVYNVFTSIPNLLLILAFAAVFQKRGLLTVIMILGVTGWTGVYRLIRAEYLRHVNREYVKAAEAIGASHMRRMFVHILPNVSHIILVNLSLLVVGFIKAEVILSYLGFGVPVEMTSWGTMLQEAQNELVIGKWWQFVAAAFLSMAVLVTAFSLLTDALRDALDPKIK
jgi:ABC-type dipeptide/oligopeptide/nickel transport system permease subunit